MAVTFHNFTRTSGPASVGTKTLLFTATAGSTLLVWTHANTAVSISGIQANNIALTRLAHISANTSRSELWGLTAPPSGVLSISANTVAAASLNFCLVATGYTGQRGIGGSPFGTAVVGTATAATSNLSVSSSATDLVAFGFGISANTTIVVNNGDTRASATHSTTGRLVVGDIAGGTTAVSISATAGTGTPVWSMIGIPIIASATAAATSLVFDNFAQTGTAVAVGSISMVLTATTDAVLMVWANINGGGSISALVAGGVNMFRLSAVEYSGGADRLELWGLTAPAAGNLTIALGLTGANVGKMTMVGVTYVGHRTTATPFGSLVIGSAATVTSTSLSVSSTAGDKIIVGWGSRMFDPVSLSVGAVMTLRGNSTIFPAVIVADVEGGPAQTASAHASSAVNWGVIALNLIQSGSSSFVTGRLSATEAADTFLATGQVIVRGLLSATEATDTFAAPGRVLVRGQISATEAADTFVATGRTLVRGTLSATDAADSFAAPGYVLVRGLLSATEAADTFVAAGQVIVRGTISATEAADTFAATGFLVSDIVTGRISATEATDSFVAPGYVVVRGLINATEAQDTFVASGTSQPSFTTGTINFTDAPDTLAATGQIIVRGLIAATDAADTFSAVGNNVSSVAAVVVQLSDGGAGGGGAKKRNDREYVPADESFWDIRERYLRSLQPAISAEPEISPPEIPQTKTEVLVNPAVLISYRAERIQTIEAVRSAPSINKMKESGRRLLYINQQIAEQKRLQALYDHYAAVEADRIRKQKQLRKLKKKVAALAALRVVHILNDYYGKL